MKIGIIGAGNIGGTAAKLFAEAGHEVAISNSRGPETLQDLVAELGNRARAVSIENAAKFGEVILISIPFGKYKTLPAHAFDRKIVIDANNYYPNRDSHINELDQEKTTSSELLAAHLKGAHIIKAFNTMQSGYLRTQGDINLPHEDRRAIFIAGNDSNAKQVVSK